METNLSSLRRLDDHPSFYRFDSEDGFATWWYEILSWDIRFFTDIHNFTYCFFSLIKEVEHCEIIEPASRESTEVHLGPDVSLLIVSILHELRDVPAEHFERDGLVEAWGVEAVD